jgi:hypothetical protein
MTPAELRAICDSLNDEHGTGGQTRLALLIGRGSSTIRRKLAGKSRNTRSDQIRKCFDLVGPEARRIN